MNETFLDKHKMLTCTTKQEIPQMEMGLRTCSEVSQCGHTNKLSKSRCSCVQTISYIIWVEEAMVLQINQYCINCSMCCDSYEC